MSSKVRTQPCDRACTSCGVWKTAENFSYGTARCKPCRVVLARTYRPNRKPLPDGWRTCSRCGERKPATAEFFGYEKRVADRCMARCRVCEEAVRDRPAAVARALRWARVHPESVRLREVRRRARKLAVVNTLTLAEWKSILEYFGHRCAYCLRESVQLTVDHILPLSGGGPNAADNVVPACASCNCSKGARGVLAMLA